MMWDFKSKSFLRGLKDHEDHLPMIRKNCEMTGCPHLGEYKAPKSRYDLRSYYWFCLDHVREYNKQWDYFKGMSAGEVEQHLHRATVWDRPTWRSTKAGIQNEDRVREQIYEAFMRGDTIFGDFSGQADEKTQSREKAQIDVSSIPHPTVEALAVMGLAPPIEWEEVKTKYKILAKKYHPDTNKHDKNAEEQLKNINLAYSILKLSYQHYLKLDE